MEYFIRRCTHNIISKKEFLMPKINFSAVAQWSKTVPAQLADLFKNRLDFTFYKELVLPLLAGLLIWPAGKYLPIECGYENGLVENTQMVLLFLAMIFCWKAKHNRALFCFFSAIIFILALRETNFGKTLFYPDPVRPNKFLSWDQIPYAPYVDPVMIAYGIAVAVYFLRKKLIFVIPAFLEKGRLPVWYIFFMAGGMISGSIIDKACDNLIAEEMAELLFYLPFATAFARAGSNSCNWLPRAEK